jgi:hypothetical protein
MIEMNYCESEEVKIEYINGTLDAGTLEDFMLHLDTCEACRHEIAGLGAVVSNLRTIEPQPVPAGLLEHVCERLRREQHTPDEYIAHPSRAAATDWLILILTTAGVLTLSFLLISILTSEPVREFAEKMIMLHLSAPAGEGGLDAGKILDTVGFLSAIVGFLLIPSMANNLYLLLRRRYTAGRFLHGSQATPSVL